MLRLFLVMSVTLILIFGLLLGILAAIGYYVGAPGYLVVLIAILLVLIQWWISPKVIWFTTNMRELKREEYPWLWEIVERLCKTHKLKIPKLALVRTSQPNAFVFGRTPSSATLAVTQGLLNTLTKEEVEAVIAHEIGHIKHKDMIVMTLASAVPVIAYFVARFLIFAPRERERGGAVLVGLLAFLVYFISNFLVLALSRLREYYADRFSGVNTSPRKLANALAKITYGLGLSSETGNEAVRCFYIADPISAKSEIAALSREYEDLQLDESEIRRAMEWEKRNPFMRVMEIFRTHPLTYKRIEALLKLESEMKKT